MALPLANYGSDSEDGDEETSTITLPPFSSTANPSSTSAELAKASETNAKKRSRPGLSFEESLARLTKRQAVSVTDHDDDSRPVIGSGVVNPGAGSVTGRTSGLFAFLPPPTNKKSSVGSVSNGLGAGARGLFSAGLPPPSTIPSSDASESLMGGVTAASATTTTMLVPTRVARQSAGKSGGVGALPNGKNPEKDELESDMFFSFATPDISSEQYSSFDDLETSTTTTTLRFPPRASTRPDVDEHLSSIASHNDSLPQAPSLPQEYTAVESYEDFYAANQVEDMDALPEGVDRDKFARMQGKRNAALERGSVQFAEVSLADQANKEQWTALRAKEQSESAGKTDMSKFQHLAPSTVAKKKHNIRALAYEAKLNADDLAAKAAHRRASMKSSKQKYGF
ncbi:hypothetical protein HDU93_000579 [Gonapodya sp. JEL0774]|nr:hypothetical protein HDU93_000579 [Gonapodya sp. JEL0774]